MHNRYTGKSRCFGFVVMKSRQGAQSVLLKSEHLLDGKVIDCKWAVPPDSPALTSTTRSRKVFVGGLPYDLTKSEFTEYFSSFGEIEDSIIMLDKVTGHPRGFGFITFRSEEAAERVLDNYDTHEIKGKWVEVKIATPKDAMGSPAPSDGEST
jgi:RNA-binding protein Musashi